ncbi:hypothetical protein KR084_001165 [Drosophila pseudotakahashii]|nr:hypothetical protein KR084_001165 [Drosophila pseudotakahashii]
MKLTSFVLCVFSLGLIYLASAEIGEYEEVQTFKKYYSSCKALNPKKSGVQKIKVGSDIIEVYCDVTIAGKGWLVVQRRVSVEENFFRNWSSYQAGFGDPKGNYFIGLNKLNKITALEPQELYVHMVDFTGASRYAYYDLFTVGNVYSNYSLVQLGAYSGTAGDSLSVHLNSPFSTYDRHFDNSTVNFAASHVGAWWYTNSTESNLNGAYLSSNLNGAYAKGTELLSGINWKTWRGLSYSLRTVNIMVRSKL